MRISLADSCDCRVGADADLTVTADGSSVRRCSGHFEVRRRPLSGENVPQRASMTEDFHGTDGGGGEGAVKKQDCDVDQGEAPRNRRVACG